MNPRPDLCQQAGVRAYPTWVVGTQRIEGVMSLDQLAQASGFRMSSPAGR